MIAKTIDMNLDHFYGMGVDLGLQNNDMIYLATLYAQAILETGSFKSNIYMTANNMFGMRPAQKRTKLYDSVLSTANGDFASYNTLEQSLRDRIALDTYNNVARPQTWEDVRVYMEKVMQKGYTHEKTYVTAWSDCLSRIISNAEDYDFSDSQGGGQDSILDSLLPEGSGGFGLMDGINKIKASYGVIGVILLSVVGWFVYKKIKK